MTSISVDLFSSFNKVVQNIYCGATAVPPTEFNRWVLNTLAEVVPYEYALGGRLVRDDPAASERFYFHPISGTLLGWNPTNNLRPPIFKGNDDLSVDAAAVSWPLLPWGEEARTDREGMDRRLRSVYSHGDDKASCFLVLYRMDPAHPFSTNDHWVVRSLLPHFIEAQRLAELGPRSGDPVADGRPRAACALIDDEGRIIAADPGFATLCLEEWPESIQCLGAEILGTCQGKEEAREGVAGKTLNITVRRLAEFHHVTVRPKHALEKLPPRLLLIARLLGKGMSYKEVAKELGISPSTVTNQANRIYPRLGIKNKAELARLITQCFVQH